MKVSSLTKSTKIRIVTLLLLWCSSIGLFAQNPLAMDDTGVTLVNTSTTIIVLLNDSGENLEVSILDEAANGTASVMPDNTVTYSPNAGFVGEDVFTYLITDAVTGLFSSASVVITVITLGDPPPVAEDDNVLGFFNEPTTIPVLANDMGIGLVVQAGSVSSPANGIAAIDVGGTTITYTPNLGFEGTDEFTYTIVDANMNTAQATVFLTIVSNHPPDIDTLTTCTEPLTSVTICYPFTDPDGDNVLIDIDASSTTFHCSLVLLNDTCFRYTPLPGFTGQDEVTLVICDDNEQSLCSEFIIYVYIGCPGPTANNDEVLVSGSTIVINGEPSIDSTPIDGFLIDATDNDSNPLDASLSVSGIVTPPGNGTATISGGQIFYTPNAGFTGTDQLEYVTCNTDDACDTAFVFIEILPATIICDNSTTVCIAPFSPLEICPEFCALEGTTIETISVEVGTGNIMEVAAGCYNYIPPAEFEAIDVVTFIACNTLGVCDTNITTIAIDADCGTNSPVALNDNVAITEGEIAIIAVLENDIEPDGGELILTSIINLGCGSAEIVGNAIVYNADVCTGEDIFSYIVCDGTGLCDTAEVMVTINEYCAFQTEYCTPSFLEPLTICVSFCNVEGNDTIAYTNTIFGCSITILNDTCLRYTPLPGFEGEETITIGGCNDLGECEEVFINVNVGCSQPDAFNDFAQIENTEIVEINALGNDIEPCGNPLNIAILTPPSNGLATVNADFTITYNPDDSFLGTDTIYYTTCNDCEEPKCDNAFIIIDVLSEIGTNLPPVAADDIVTTPLNTLIDIDILANDSDPDNNIAQMTITIVDQPANGTVIIVDGSSVQYTPNADFSGTDEFTYIICDPQGECDDATVTVFVGEGAVANPDIVFTSPMQLVIINVLDNDTGEGIEISQVTLLPSLGILTAVDPVTGTINYIPNDTTGTDYLFYEVCDDYGNCDTTIVTIVIMPLGMNLPPNAHNDQIITNLSTAVTIPILNNDTDPNGDALTVTDILGGPFSGTVNINADGTATYTPDPSPEAFCDVFSYIICDPGGLCDTALVTVAVGTEDCLNNPPVAITDVSFTLENDPVHINVLSNDSDPDGDVLHVEFVTVPTNGTTSINADNTITYHPNEDFVGTDFFAYVLCDAGSPSLCDTAFVSVDVFPQGLSAEPDIVYTPFNTLVVIDPLVNDNGTSIEITSILSTTSQGTLIVELPGETIQYQPDPGFVGVDYFEYQICDIEGDCDVTVVAIIVLPADVTNIHPNAVNDMATTPVNTSILIDVLANDSDPFGGTTINIIDVAAPDFGAVSAGVDGITYFPDIDFIGIDQFTYVICDDQIPSLCDSATVTINVGSDILSNTAPLAFDDFATTELSQAVDIAILANDLDADGDFLTIVTLVEPVFGNLSSDGSGTITYTPLAGFSGNDYFMYIICDNGTPILCDTAYVTISVEGETTQIDVETLEDTALEICIDDYLSGGFVLDSIMITNPSDNGLLLIEGACLTYIPNANYNGLDNIELQACSDNGICIPVTVNISVIPVPDAPIALDDTESVTVNELITIDILGNDTDPDGDLLTNVVLILTPPSVDGATLTENSDGVYIFMDYTPAPNYIGTDSFQYVVFDNTGISDTAWVTLFIDSTATEDLYLVAMPDIDTTIMATSVTISVLANDTLPPIEEIGFTTVHILAEPTNGVAFQDDLSTGMINYIPNPDFNGVDTLIYEVCISSLETGIEYCDQAEVIIYVLPETCEVNSANGFSPNGDNINDEYLFSGIEGACFSETQFSLTIFNRWGSAVYTIEDYSNTENAWTGRYDRTSEDVPVGTYFYLLKYDMNGTPMEKAGYIELRR